MKLGHFEGGMVPLCLPLVARRHSYSVGACIFRKVIYRRLFCIDCLYSAGNLVAGTYCRAHWL